MIAADRGRAACQGCAAPPQGGLAFTSHDRARYCRAHLAAQPPARTVRRPPCRRARGGLHSARAEQTDPDAGGAPPARQGLHKMPVLFPAGREQHGRGRGPGLLNKTRHFERTAKVAQGESCSSTAPARPQRRGRSAGAIRSAAEDGRHSDAEQLQTPGALYRGGRPPFPYLENIETTRIRAVF